MNSRERVLRAFGKLSGEPDRIPLQFDLCKGLLESFSRRLGIDIDYSVSYYEDLTYRISANKLRTAMGSDVAVVGGTVKEDFTPRRVEGDTTLNEFGMHMKPTSLYVEVVKCPLADVDSVQAVQDYAFPDPNALGRFTDAERDVRELGETHFVIGDCELSLFELAWHLTGLEKYMMSLAMEDEWLEALNDRVEEWTTGIAVRLANMGVDALWFGEDLGTQTSVLISPEMWRERFRYRHERIIKKVREINPDILIIMHSDGAVAPLLDDFVEMGVDVYNPVQPNVPGSDPEELKRTYGDSLFFFGGIDQQELLPRGDADSIRKEVEYRARVFGRNGGYLMAPAHIIQADTAVQTVDLFINAVKALA